jgi:hypothetical protein
VSYGYQTGVELLPVCRGKQGETSVHYVHSMNNNYDENIVQSLLKTNKFKELKCRKYGYQKQQKIP